MTNINKAREIKINNNKIIHKVRTIHLKLRAGELVFTKRQITGVWAEGLTMI